MKTLQFEERFFANKDEWQWFLSQLGLKDNYKDKYIDVVYIKVDEEDIEINFQDV